MPLSLSLSMLVHCVASHLPYTVFFYKSEHCVIPLPHRRPPTLNINNSHKVCALSHIYTYMTFGLFTYLSPSNRSGRIETGSSVFWFSLTSIRRDLFPNKVPLQSGMGCRTSPIRFRHASSLSGISTLVSISDPFSAVWIFVSANSRSSTRSRIQ